MTHRSSLRSAALALVALAAIPGRVLADVSPQCPGDANGDAIPDGPVAPNVKCLHLGAGDGFVTMADGRPMYMFGFADLTGIAAGRGDDGRHARGQLPGPDHHGERGRRAVPHPHQRRDGDAPRPLRPAHRPLPRVPQRLAGRSTAMPDGSIAINMGATLTYYYAIAEPGTYMYHCHVEATEHMQMGMLGNLYVRPGRTARATSTRPARAACTRGSPTTTATAAPATTASSRSSSARSTRTSTTRAGPSSPCRSRTCATATR